MTRAWPQPRSARRHGMLALLLALVALLLALGSWQLQRRAWKLDLIARVESRAHAPLQPAPARDQWPQVTAQHDEYRHVQLQGRWLHAQSAWVTAATALGSGYWLMTPLQLSDGGMVWVNRGHVSPDTRAHWSTPEDGHGEVTGLLRMSETGRRWLRLNDPPTERWVARDVQALSARRGLGPTAPYFVDADASARGEAEPVGGLTIVQFTNHHLLYALTWFALAILAAGGCWLIWREPAHTPT